MKKVLNATAIVFCLFFYQIPYSFCQDTQNEKPKKEVSKEDNEDEGDLIKEDNTTTKKKAHQKAIQPVAFGIEAGLNMAKMDVKYNGNYNTYDYLAGGRIGIILDIPVADHFFIQPGISYVMNGSKVSSSDDGYGSKSSGTVNVNTAELAFNLLYKFGMPGNGRFFIGIGPYLGYNISANAKEKITNSTYNIDTTETVNYKIGSTNGTDDLKAIDLGIGLNLGYQLANGLFFRGRYQGGLTNLSPNTGTTIHTSSIGLQIGFLFGQKVKHKHIAQKDDAYIERKM